MKIVFVLTTKFTSVLKICDLGRK